MRCLLRRIGPVVVASLMLTACGSAETEVSRASSVGATMSGSVVDAGASESSPTLDPMSDPASATSGAASPATSDSPASGPANVVRARRGSLIVRKAAKKDAKPVATLTATTPMGSARVLLAKRDAGEWIEVLLPVRPNGATGWVRRSDVVVQQITERIVIDISDRTLVLRAGGSQVVSTKVATGAARTPTPVGTFFVTDRVRTTDPKGAYGAFALGISAHSASLTKFGDGDAQIGIHGTNEPASIGTATTHGCVRVPNSVVRKLEDVPLGTPIDIVA